VDLKAGKQLSPFRQAWALAGTLPRVNTSPLLVACLCAQWCGSCRDYAALFEQASAAFGKRCRFVWIDIEDQADLLDGVEVDNFPTLLIARATQPLFFGAITPHPQTLNRLVTGALAGELKVAVVDHRIAALVGRLVDQMAGKASTSRNESG